MIKFYILNWILSLLSIIILFICSRYKKLSKIFIQFSTCLYILVSIQMIYIIFIMLQFNYTDVYSIYISQSYIYLLISSVLSIGIIIKSIIHKK